MMFIAKIPVGNNSSKYTAEYFVITLLQNIRHTAPVAAPMATGIVINRDIVLYYSMFMLYAKIKPLVAAVMHKNKLAIIYAILTVLFPLRNILNDSIDHVEKVVNAPHSPLPIKDAHGFDSMP